MVNKNHVNAGKSRRSGPSQTKSDARQSKSGRERNIGHKGGEEHSRTAKGNSGQHGKRR